MEDVTLRELAQDLSYEWESLASFLGFKAAEITALKMDHPGQTQNQVFNMLVRWRQRQGPRVDLVADLSAALGKVQRTDLAVLLQGPRNSVVASQPHAADGQNADVASDSTSEDSAEGTKPQPETDLVPEKPRESSSGQQVESALPDIETDRSTATTTNSDLHGAEGKKPKQEAHPGCSKHEGEAAQFMCMTCLEVICSRCADEVHCRPRHHCLSCDAAAEKYRSVLASRIPVLEEQVGEIRGFLEKSRRVRTEFGDNASRTVQEVRDRAARVVARVKAEESRLIEKVRELERVRAAAFQDQEKRASVLLAARRHALETASEVAKVGQQAEFLSRYLTVGEVLEVTSSRRCPRVDPGLSYLSLTPASATSLDSDGLSLGRLDLAGRWVKRAEFGCWGDGPGQLQLAKGIAARQQGEIEVADYINRRVVVFTTDGEVVRTVPTQGVPRDIAAQHTQLAVVDDANRVQLYTRYNMVASVVGRMKPRRSDFRSVALTTYRTVVVGDVIRSALTEHSCADGALKRTVSLKMKPYFIAVAPAAGARRERVVVSGGFQKEVHVVDYRSEAVVAVIRPRVDGQAAYQCTGVCCDDSSGAIYVALAGKDTGQGHVHQYDADGAFCACVARGLHSPQGITFTADGYQLAVADTYSVKMYHKV